jgi:hypothetical protein
VLVHVLTLGSLWCTWLSCLFVQLFEKESSRRANQKVALQQAVKFGGLFADSAASIGLTFALPAPTMAAAEEEDGMDDDDE